MSEEQMTGLKNEKKALWQPSSERIINANITQFIHYVNYKYHLKINSYTQLYNWSINNLSNFWAEVWDFSHVISSRPYSVVLNSSVQLPGAMWFDGARLNFAENLLRFRDHRNAFIFKGETQVSKSMTYAELYDTVARLAKSLRELGVRVGDRVCGYMPNLMETGIAMLATTSIGAIWCSCATDIGSKAAVERLGQVKPKVLFTADGYFYKGKKFDSLSNVAKIIRDIKTLEKVVIVSYTEDRPDISHIEKSVHYGDFLSKGKNLKIEFEQLPFDHPVYIMFSSGTTGKPKCMVQGAGGILINHIKELLLHSDLKREDKIMYITTCSWMMWNWMISSLAIGATVVLFDGNPSYPDSGAIWKLVQDEKITIFGTSASYLHFLKKEGIKPGETYDLSSLKEISQTGSALSPEGFEYVYRGIKSDLHLNSIAGGTDINGCFAIGNPISPVYAGELQAPGLGMKIKSYDDKGHPVYDEQGELVCEAASPSMPLYFWDDPDNNKYVSAYFKEYPGVWRHGDYIVVHSDTGGITFYGRSDAVLKPSGVRIGTAEIYNEVDKFKEIADSLAIGQNWQGDQRVLLFVKFVPGFSLTDDLQKRIKNALRDNASPRHVPARIIEVPCIPYTMNGKKVESSITAIVNGMTVTNRDALVNPESLDYYQSILPEL
jgi:acetoacetyl-CoA synthetase